MLYRCGLKPNAALLISLPKLAATIMQRVYQNVILSKADYAYQTWYITMLNYTISMRSIYKIDLIWTREYTYDWCKGLVRLWVITIVCILLYVLSNFPYLLLILYNQNQLISSHNMLDSSWCTTTVYYKHFSRYYRDQEPFQMVSFIRSCCIALVSPSVCIPAQ